MGFVRTLSFFSVFAAVASDSSSLCSSTVDPSMCGVPEPTKQTWTLAFGSCLHQSSPAPVLLSVAASKPDVFVWLGDNLYNDVSSGGALCDPLSCKRSYLQIILDTLLVKVHKLLFSISFTHAWAKQLGEAYAEAHNNGANDEDVDALRANYVELASKPEFQALKRATPTQLATWDDHDYCRNDAGRDCAIREGSQRIFLDFWRGTDRKDAGDHELGDPKSPTTKAALNARGGRGGVYESYSFSVPVPPSPRVQNDSVFRVQVIMLDTRWFRSPLARFNASSPVSSSPPPKCRLPWDPTSPGEYCAQGSPSTSGDGHVEAPTLLGEEQWAWLEGELSKPGFQLRVIGSSVNFGATYNGMEAWSLFPVERLKFAALIARTKASGVVFLSGDVHYGELSVFNSTSLHSPAESRAAAATPLADLPEELPYPLYDATSSGLTQADSWFVVPPNFNRIPGTKPVGGVGGNNWGKLTVDFGTAHAESETPHQTTTVSSEGVGEEDSESQKNDGVCDGDNLNFDNPSIRFEIFDASGEVGAELSFKLSDIGFKL